MISPTGPWEPLARALGDYLGTSSEFKDLVEAEKAYAKDKAAQALVKEAQEAGAQLQSLQRGGRKLDPAEAQKFVAIQANLDASSVVQRLVKSQKAYDALVQDVNRKVQETVEAHRKSS